eukprot:scaffold1786_cov398-Prasinococcus_capsulatus_cf.AAC.24
MFEEQQKILEARRAGTNFSEKQDSKEKMKALKEREREETAAAVEAARNLGAFGMTAEELRVRMQQDCMHLRAIELGHRAHPELPDS